MTMSGDEQLEFYRVFRRMSIFVGLFGLVCACVILLEFVERSSVSHFEWMTVVLMIFFVLVPVVVTLIVGRVVVGLRSPNKARSNL